MTSLHERVIDWFDGHHRVLPWRSDPQPWAVMVSEFMLQQTPVVRVRPVFEAWMQTWPTPADLAAASTGDPRRALRLHAAAVAIVEHHDGAVPSTYDELIQLPGVGDYTAAAIASFAFGARHAVMDTNVRRVFARVLEGKEFPADAVNKAERELARSVLPLEDAHRWAAATMELGAVVCTAKSPDCDACPIPDLCDWRKAGYPAHDGPARRGQAWAGTDRQVRGRLMAVLRDADGPVPKAALDAVWDDEIQRERCLDSLVADGLVDPVREGFFSLPD